MSGASVVAPLRVVVADDDELLLTALAMVLDLQEGVEVVGRARDGREAVEVVTQHRPDVALVDLEMPRMDGIEVAAELAGVVPDTAVVVVTRHARPALLKRALAVGARGFILKSTSSEEMVRIVRDVHSGQRYIDPEIAGLALTMRECPLTDREREVLSLVHAGRRTNEIAAQLHLAPGTVRNYISTAMTRLAVPTGREAAAVAYAEGWI